MKQPSIPPIPLDDSLQRHILGRTQAINVQVLTQLSTVADDLAQGQHRAALGGLDGLERQINTMRSFLLLLP